MRDDLILASASPRRAELLEQIGVRFRVVPADIDETPLAEESPDSYVGRLAVEKAVAVSRIHPGQPVLAADTTVVSAGQIMGKPGDANQSDAMLRQLSGRWHEVLTGVAVHSDAAIAQTVIRTRVAFRTIDEHERSAYWRSGEPRGKAGGYAIQGLGAVFVQRIEGSYSNVVGLPLAETAQFLHQAGVVTGLDSGLICATSTMSDSE